MFDIILSKQTVLSTMKDRKELVERYQYLSNDLEERIEITVTYKKVKITPEPIIYDPRFSFLMPRRPDQREGTLSMEVVY